MSQQLRDDGYADQQAYEKHCCACTWVLTLMSKRVCTHDMIKILLQHWFKGEVPNYDNGGWRVTLKGVWTPLLLSFSEAAYDADSKTFLEMLEKSCAFSKTTLWIKITKTGVLGQGKERTGSMWWKLHLCVWGLKKYFLHHKKDTWGTNKRNKRNTWKE